MLLYFFNLTSEHPFCLLGHNVLDRRVPTTNSTNALHHSLTVIGSAVAPCFIGFDWTIKWPGL